jgi:shikimate dehydrogenase
MKLKDAEYSRLRVAQGTFSERWTQGDFEGINGLSVTMPHKHAVTLIATELSDRVRMLGAANTLVIDKGRVCAENTDVDGIIHALTLGADQGPLLGREPHELPRLKKVLIIGGGGTAAAALAACRELGVKKAIVALRSPQKAEQGPVSLIGAAGALGLNLRVIGFDDVRSTLRSGVDAVISTLPPRAADPFASDWAREAAAEGLPPALLDVAYDPWPSRLAQEWPGRVIHGLEMLLYQAVRQVELFTGGRVTNSVVAAMASAVDLPARTR